MPTTGLGVEGELCGVIALSGPLSRFTALSAEVRRVKEEKQDERIRACYQHAVMKVLSGERMKNQTLCERFGVDLKNAAQISKVIKSTLDKGLIKPADSEHPRAGYAPFWA